MAATLGTVLGVFNGVSLAATYADTPANLDILQIISENGGKVVVNVSSTGVVSLNPASPTNGTSVGVYVTDLTGAPTIAQYFQNVWPDAQNLDILQIYSEVAAPVVAGSGGQVLIGRLSNLGVYSTN